MKERLKQWVLQKLSLNKAAGEDGVTLIELLAVVVILGVIAAVAVPVVGNSITKSKENVTQQNMAIIAQALARYAAEHDGSYPAQATEGTLSSIQTDLSNYLQATPQDGWGGDFYYVTTSTGYTLNTAAAATDAGVTGINAPSGDEKWTMTNTQAAPKKS
jgi:prepilin-type N-terminal cleavage/methylation domain-containing protein